MIFESTEESRDFLTRYTVDYFKHVPKKLPPCEWSPAFPYPLSILNGPYKWHLNTSKKNESLPFEKRTEDPRDYGFKVGERYPKLKKLIPESFNEELIEREEKKVARTHYQAVYSKDLGKRGDEKRTFRNLCNLIGPKNKAFTNVQDWHHKRRTRKLNLTENAFTIDDFLSLRAQKLGTHLKRAILPDDWVIPLTVQKRSFRNPWEIIREDLLRVQRKGSPPNNLDPNLKEREILRVRTGTSEYQGAIAAKADKIMREKPFGSPLPIEPPRMSRVRDPQKKSECSLFLAKKDLTLPSNVF